MFEVRQDVDPVHDAVEEAKKRFGAENVERAAITGSGVCRCVRLHVCAIQVFGPLLFPCRVGPMGLAPVRSPRAVSFLWRECATFAANRAVGTYVGQGIHGRLPCNL